MKQERGPQTGLDQYLYADVYIPRWSHSSSDDRARADQVLEVAGLTALQEEDAGVTVRATVGYWRKANQIHKWFVDNVQGGKDDCGTYYVDKGELEELHEKCILVLASSEMVPDNVSVGRQYEPSTGSWRNMLEKGEVILDPKVAQEELPSADGFFFGATDYDQWYVMQLVRTVEIIEKLLPKMAVSEWSGVGMAISEEGIRDLGTGEPMSLPSFDLFYHASW